MKRTKLFLLAVVLALWSCAGWQTTAWHTVDVAQKSSQKLAESAVPVLNSMCDSEVTDCEERADAACPGYKACAAIRNAFVNTYIWTQIACADAEAAILIAEQESAVDAVTDVLRLLKRLREQLREGGVLQ